MKSLATCLLLATIFVMPRVNRAQFAMILHLPPSQRSGDATDLYERGRTVFGNRCGKCHDEDAAKKLPDGTSLVQRLAESKDPEALAGTRLKKMNEQDRRAVWAYLNVLVGRYRSPGLNKSESKPPVPPR